MSNNQTDLKEIKVLDFYAAQIITEFEAPGLWKLAEDVTVNIKTSEGYLRYKMLKGFVTDMRSGAAIINPVIPKFTGNNLYNAAILTHDCNYSCYNADGDHFVSRLLADQLLRGMAQKSGELGAFRAGLMYRAVRIGGHWAYNSPNTGAYKDIAEFIKMTREAK